MFYTLSTICELVLLPYANTLHMYACCGLTTSWNKLFHMYHYHLVGLVVKASASKAEDPGFESRLRRDFFRVESYSWLNNWHSSGYPAWRLVLQGQCWGWLVWCQYIVTGWGGKFALQLHLSVAARKIAWADLSLRYTCMHIAGTLSNQQTSNKSCIISISFIYLCY